MYLIAGLITEGKIRSMKPIRWKPKNQGKTSVTADRLHDHYRVMMAEEKCWLDFRDVSGAAPSDWFRSCQRPEARRFRDDGNVVLGGHPPHVLFQRRKGLAQHYHQCFLDDPKLQGLAACLSGRSGAANTLKHVE